MNSSSGPRYCGLQTKGNTAGNHPRKCYNAANLLSGQAPEETRQEGSFFLAKYMEISGKYGEVR